MVYVGYVKWFYVKQWKEISFLLHFVVDCIMDYPADFGNCLVSNLFGLQLSAKRCFWHSWDKDILTSNAKIDARMRTHECMVDLNNENWYYNCLFDYRWYGRQAKFHWNPNNLDGKKKNTLQPEVASLTKCIKSSTHCHFLIFDVITSFLCFSHNLSANNVQKNFQVRQCLCMRGCSRCILHQYIIRFIVSWTVYEQYLKLIHATKWPFKLFWCKKFSCLNIIASAIGCSVHYNF